MVSPPDGLGAWIQSSLATYGYASASDDLQELVSRDQEAASDDARRLADLHLSIDRGLGDIRAGRGRDAREVFDRLEAKYETMARERESL